MRQSALMRRQSTIRRHVVVDLKSLQLLHEFLLDLLVGHVLDPFDDYVWRCLLWQRLAHGVAGGDILTDGDACRRRLLVETSAVASRRSLARRLSVGLLAPSRCAVGLGVVIVVYVDVIVVDDLDDFARGALAELSDWQLAQAQCLQLLLELNVGILVVASPVVGSLLACVPRKRRSVPLCRRVLLRLRTQLG